jgi:hypothetical protein
MALVIRVVKTYLSIARRSTVSETAERLIDLADAHIRNAGYGGFSFRDLAAEIGIKSASCITISPPTPRWLPLLLGVTETVSLPQSLGARMRAPGMPSPFTDWPSGSLSVALG